MSNYSDIGAMSARYHVECPGCRQAKGQVEIEQFAPSADGATWCLKLTCKKCGNLGTTDFDWDFAVPPGVTVDQHGEALGHILTVWLKDNPPPAIDQLARLGREVSADQPEGPVSCCPRCGVHYQTAGGHKCGRGHWPAVSIDPGFAAVVCVCGKAGCKGGDHAAS